MPKVSVIIPTYNSAKYIFEAIDSVMSQTYKDYEIIVVDDGSTDNTKGVLKKYDGRIRYFYQENRGPSAARNRGIKESTGEYIAFLDDDDVWFSHKLKLQVDIMELNPDAAMIFTDGESFTEAGLKSPTFRSASPRHPLLKEDSFSYKISNAEWNDGSILKGNFYRDLYLGNLVFNSSVLMRKKCLREVGDVDEKLTVNSDYDLWIRIAQKFPILYLNKVTAKWRIREDSLSGGISIRVFNYSRWDGLLFEKHLQLCPPEYRGISRERIYECYRFAVWGYFHNGELPEARRLCWKSLQYKITQPKLYVYVLLSFLPWEILNYFKGLKKFLVNLVPARE